jgi:CheY-like chemotaxis protein
MKGENEKTILVVDDSMTNVVLLEAILHEKGYNIQTAQSAKEAITVLKKHDVHLILLDLLMPKITGFDFLKDLKENEETSKIPVIIVSAVGNTENKRKTLEMGAVDFVNKPIDILIFTKKVEDVLNNHTVKV